MGRRGYVQKRQAEHDTAICLSDWAQATAEEYLSKKGINVCTGDQSGMSDPSNSDHWEIEFPYRKVKGEYVRDFDRMYRIIADLEKHPGSVKGEDGKGTYGEQLAAILRSGVEAAEKRGYNWIMVDFW